jgi:glycosyltransferase involved in cell wall biosynthesis
VRIVLSHLYGWPEVHRGTERYVHELSAALQALGHDVLVLVSTAGTTGSDQVLGVPVRRVRRRAAAVSPPRRKDQLAFAARSLLPALRHRPDVWHANSLYDGALAASLPGVRSVLTAHGPLTGETLRRPVFAVARRAGAIVTVSEAASREAATAGVATRAVPPGVDTSTFSPGGSRAPRPVVLYVGTLDTPRKNVDLLLRAVAERPDVELWLVGPGDSRRVLEQAPSSVCDRVKHLGVLNTQDLVDAYRQAWCLALLSEREVFGMAVLEGMACGTPALVLADGWGPQEQITASTGVATTREDVSTGLAAVLELSRRAGTIEACRSNARGYDWKTGIAPRLLEVYAGG